MSDNNRFDDEPVNYSDLIFDWGNPSAPTKKVQKAPEPAVRSTRTVKEETSAEQKETDLLREETSAVSGRSGTPAKTRTGRGKNAGASAAAQILKRKISVPSPDSDYEEDEEDEVPAVRKVPKKKAPRAEKAKPTRTSQLLKRSKRKAMRNRLVLAAIAVAVLAVVIFLVLQASGLVKKSFRRSSVDGMPGFVEENYLSVNSYSRPGISTHKLTGIVLHNTAEPGVTAGERREYYESLAESHATRASVNYIVGLEGEVIACVPAGEVAYASNDRNLDTVSVEFCHPDETGAMTEETYASVVELVKWLRTKYTIGQEGVIRHYDVTGKLCPKFYVEDPEAWEKFLKDIGG